MEDIVQIFNSKITCPSCGDLYSSEAHLWRRTTMPKGDGTVLIAALCYNCTKGGLTRKQIKDNTVILKADRAGRIIGSYFQMSPSGWIPAFSENFI